jgi:hypothetical protein
MIPAVLALNVVERGKPTVPELAIASPGEPSLRKASASSANHRRRSGQ